ncbi:MAG: arginine--tRNA ligase [Phascolarctobacterium sp.]|nr:arginine--tRNA ligase [Candidatus Phascolarctobacterium caballi]
MNIKEILAKAIVAAVAKAQGAGTLPAGDLAEAALEVPPQKEFGDFSSNFAMKSAKGLKCNPRMIAQAIIDNLDCPFVDRMEIAGPGFLNFYLKSDWLCVMLGEIIKAGKNYGNLPKRNDGKIQVEFVSANPTGPLHVGHGRGAAYGSALCNLMEAAGYDVDREYYINDAGIQMNGLADSVDLRYRELLGEKIKEDELVYHGYDIVETAQRIVDNYGDKFLKLSTEERRKEFLSLAYKEKLAAVREDLANFNVTYDVWFSEKTLHEAGAIKAACDLLTSRGYMYEKDGALWLNATEHGDDKDRVVIRDNGVPTYFAADIAYHKNKFERGFKKVINIWGADHHGYVARMKAAIGALGYDPNQLEILLLQMVSLYRNGEMVKLSKRTGNTITLKELIEEVGVDAARFFFVMRSIDSQLDFDMGLATEESNDNPVYYIQYAHARICSIFRQLKDANIVVKDNPDLQVLTDATEIDLIKKLGDYPEMLAGAAEDRAVHRVATYIHELAGLFHSFYNQCRILGVDEDVQQARIALITAVRHVVEHALNILGVSAPEHM